MIERAVTHEVISRDGTTITRECSRPDEIRANARRVMAWRDAPEGCGLCRGGNAVAIRSGIAVCATCRRENRNVVSFDPPLSSRSIGMNGGNPEDGLLRGYAIVFDQRSVKIGGDFYEVIAPSAITRTMTERPDMRALVEHVPSDVIGRQSAGRLQYTADKFGLRVAIDPPNTTVASNIKTLVAERLVTGMSFSFSTIEDDWVMADNVPLRTVLDMRVSEVSIVGWPAYPQTSVELSLRSQSGRSIEWLSMVQRNRSAR